MREQTTTERGQLTIFAGYAAGTGKTYAMLQAGLRAREQGVDVVAGAARRGEWPETARLFEQLERLPQRPDGEPDLDALLRRRPQLVLLGGLAHENAPNSRNRRRYQDVEELLQAGIDVYTTLDVQHLESLQDTVAAILGRGAERCVPDEVFDQADRIVFADLEPAELLARLSARNAVGARQQGAAVRLDALREMGLRRCADRIARRARTERARAPYRIGEHILVCLSAESAGAKIVRAAARMAGAYGCPLTALLVETRDTQKMTAAARKSLQNNIRLAQQLGATVETVYGDDVPYQIAEYVRLANISKVVLAGVDAAPQRWRHWDTLAGRLTELAPEVEIHLVPVPRAGLYFPQLRMTPMPLRDFAKGAGLLLLATLLGFVFDALGFTEVNIITVYILGVMLTSVLTKSSLCCLVSSVASVLVFNFFFTEPRLTLHAYDSGYPVTFLVMFAAAMITGSLAARLKSHAEQSARITYRTKVLFDTNRSLQKAGSRDDILAVTAGQLVKLFGRGVVAYPAEKDGLGQPRWFPAGPADTAQPDGARERETADWVYHNNRRAGAGTETLADARCLYLSIRMGVQVYGVIGIVTDERPLDPSEDSILLAVLGECALALENRKNAEEKEAAAVLAKNEQLRANLLRSLSHDLRTPLTSISGNASNLLSNGSLFDDATKQQMYGDIYDDAAWLINLVENLLSVSRFEQGHMNLRLSTELMDEVVTEALRHINRKRVDYHLSVDSEDEYILARIDAKLIVQVIINIVDNAIKYTPPGSDIAIHLRQQGGFVLVSIADNGPGIPDEAKPRVFDMFYSVSNKAADSRRSLGLGLALCKSIIGAHGGELTVTDNVPHGCIFTFSVPAGEVEIHE